METVDWNQRYAEKKTPWDSGEPSRELARIIAEGWFGPCRLLELGCGTGTNAIYLASKGFDVTALDVAGLAIEEANRKSSRSFPGRVRFLAGDILHPPDLAPPFPVVFDRGVYHHLRTVDLEGFLRVLERYTEPGGFYITLAGNANEEAEEGPPRVHGRDLVSELDGLFDLVQLREFRFDGVLVDGVEVRPLAWSALLRRKVGARAT